MAGSEPRRRFTHSLMGRLTLAGIVPAVLVILVLVAVNSSRRYFNMLDFATTKLAADAEELSFRLDNANRLAVDVGRMIALAQSSGMYGKRTETNAFLRKVLEAYPDITGTYVVYEPNGDGKDATERIPGATVVAGPADESGLLPAVGRFAPYYFRNWQDNNAIALKPTADMNFRPFYQAPRTAWLENREARTLITEPYEYQGQYIVEQTWPIIIDGEFKGIGGTDRALDRIRADLQKYAAETRSDVFLLSPGGRIIAATDGSESDYSNNIDPDAIIAEEYSKTAYSTLFPQLVKDPRAFFSVRATNPGTGADCFFACARIPTGSWQVVMAVPARTVTGPILMDLSITWGIALCGLCAIVVILWIPARQIVTRVDSAASAAKQVAAGDLTREPSCVECPDETGELLRALDSMTADLNSLVGQVRTASIQLTTTATELGATSRQQEEVAASFGASSSEIAAAVREITTTGQELAREMVHVSESASATAHLAQEGRAQLEGMEGAMQALDQATGGVADRLAAINEKAVNITGVVTTITKVAEQTNLLSVNAAIEAEKAGEYGRGFLVVAREIRRLADQTGQATLDIERMVKEMQAAVSSGVMEMDRFSDQVRRNVNDVRGIGRSMQEIIVRVDEGTTSFGTVREGMQSQAAGAAQISEAMTTLSSNAKATSESVSEFGRAADELQNAIGTLKTAIAAFHLRS